VATLKELKPEAKEMTRLATTHLGIFGMFLAVFQTFLAEPHPDLVVYTQIEQVQRMLSRDKEQ
jgi:hypothetical protein